jgi:hypothetical protein
MNRKRAVKTGQDADAPPCGVTCEKCQMPCGERMRRVKHLGIDTGKWLAGAQSISKRGKAKRGKADER